MGHADGMHEMIHGTLAKHFQRDRLETASAARTRRARKQAGPPARLPGQRLARAVVRLGARTERRPFGV